MAGLNSLAINLKSEEDGIWETLFEMDFLVARAGNDAWKKRSRKLEKQAYGNKLRNKDFKRDPEIDQDILIDCLSKTAILDWKHVSLDGVDIPYSPEKSYEVLSDRRFRNLTEALLDTSLNGELYLEEAIMDDEKK